MATSFEVLSLGNFALIDPGEGNQSVSQGAVNSCLGTYGSLANPLSNSAQANFAPGSTGFSGGRGTVYELDNSVSNDTFTIDGVEKTHDATMLFNATITYKDGTTANVSAVVAQDTNGDAYLMPEVTNNADAAAYAAGPVASITLNSPIYGGGNTGQGYNLIGDRIDTNFVPCFTPGTMIATKRGLRPVEDLRPGDRVITRDNGLQELLWVGQRDVPRHWLTAKPDLHPILIRAGSLGTASPDRDTMVSPNHRMLMIDERAQLIWDEREVLIAAKHLTYLPGVKRAQVDQVTYTHVMFRHHQVILANGAWSESFQPGQQAMDGLAQDSRDEILRLFPELATAKGQSRYMAARLSLKGFEARLLAA